MVPVSEHSPSRSFGISSTSNYTTAETTFLHTVIDSSMPELRDRLRGLAAKADRLGGWGVWKPRENAAISMRCVEQIRYSGEGGAESQVGWHADGATLLTMALLLNAAAEFEVGVSERVRRKLRRWLGGVLGRHVVHMC